MISKLPFLGALLLSSSALAYHPSQPGATLARRDELCTIDANLISWNTASAGSMLNGESFSFVTATVTIPTLKGSDGVVVISIGLDSGCMSGSVGIGLQGNLVDGKALWNAWGQWLPNPPVDLNVTMRARDTIKITLVAFSLKTGVVIWQNQKGHIVTHEFNAANPLCMMNAGWAVRVAADQNGSPFPLANFGTITFTNTMAKVSGSSDTYFPCGPSGYRIYGVQQNGLYLANVSGSASTLVVSHL